MSYELIWQERANGQIPPPTVHIFMHSASPSSLYVFAPQGLDSAGLISTHGEFPLVNDIHNP